MKLDELDLSILRCLQADARRSYRSLAQELGTTTPTVSARVKNLEALGLILGYHARVEPGIAGGTQHVVSVKVRPGDAEGVLAALANEEWVEDSFLVAGGGILAVIRTGQGVPTREVHAMLGGLQGVVEYDMREVLQRRTRLPRVAAGAVPMACHHCARPVLGEPVTLRLHGRLHVFCCPLCRDSFSERHATLAGDGLTSGKKKP